MATAKKNSTKTASKKTSTGKSAAKKTSGTPRTGTPASMKPISTAMNRSGLIAHLAEAAGSEATAVRTRRAALDATLLASVHRKCLGSFTLTGLLKINVVNVPAKKKRRGIDPFTKVEREFAAKPASVKIKTRALKKLKDAAL